MGAPKAERPMIQRFLSATIYTLSSVLGIFAFLAPFFGIMLQNDNAQASAPWLMSAIVGLCFISLLVEVQGTGLNAKHVALLGVLVAINSVLRFAEVAFPGPGGFTPIFLLIILSGYVFGAQIGFLMGALTLFVSALITGGVGPWLPYQMISAAWVGLSAPLIKPLAHLLGGANSRGELLAIMLFGAVWGFAYGAIMNLWFWPYATGASTHYWQPGVGPIETLQRYAAFYLLTSFVWDSFNAAGNVVLLACFGAPVLRALRRFRKRLDFTYQPSGSTV
jgi:energy-coupling factor transport system substrate-specific component